MKNAHENKNISMETLGTALAIAVLANLKRQIHKPDEMKKLYVVNDNVLVRYEGGVFLIVLYHNDIEDKFTAEEMRSFVDGINEGNLHESLKGRA